MNRLPWTIKLYQGPKVTKSYTSFSTRLFHGEMTDWQVNVLTSSSGRCKSSKRYATTSNKPATTKVCTQASCENGDVYTGTSCSEWWHGNVSNQHREASRRIHNHWYLQLMCRRHCTYSACPRGEVSYIIETSATLVVTGALLLIYILIPIAFLLLLVRHLLLLAWHLLLLVRHLLLLAWHLLLLIHVFMIDIL